VSKYGVVAIIPIKAHSERYKNKNFRILRGKALYKHLLDKIEHCKFDRVFIDTDSDEIKNYAGQLGYCVIDRLPGLAGNNANGNDLLLHESTIVDAEIFFQLFITAPFLRSETINRAIEILQTDESYDSLFTAHKMYTWFWYDGDPVNYDPKQLPRSQDAKPVIKETTGLYAIRKEALKKTRCRVGDKPFMLFLDYVESIDIDNEIDLYIAESIAAKK